MKNILSGMVLAFGCLVGMAPATADTFTQGGHGCKACEICTAQSCSCRDYNCDQYMHTNDHGDKVTASKVDAAVKGATPAKPKVMAPDVKK